MIMDIIFIIYSFIFIELIATECLIFIYLSINYEISDSKIRRVMLKKVPNDKNLIKLINDKRISLDIELLKNSANLCYFMINLPSELFLF